MTGASSSSRFLYSFGTFKGWRGVLWLPDRMGCHNLDSERAGLCPRGGEPAIDDFSVGHNLPIPVAGRTVPGDPIRKCAFLSHDDESRRSGLILPKRFPGMSVSVPSDYSLRRVPTNPVIRLLGRLTLELSKKIRCFSNMRRLPSSASSSDFAISECWPSACLTITRW
jgi:hypothetical protein